MKNFRIEQNYVEHGTNYFEVEANSLDEAIEKVENLEEYSYHTDYHDFEVINYDGSEQLKEKKHGKQRVAKTVRKV